MQEPHFGQWQAMDTAPKDGSRVLVEVRASEQGPAEVDVARWVRTERGGDGSWVAADSDPGCLITYAEAELMGWMPLPSPLPKLRGGRTSPVSALPGVTPAADEIGGSGI